MKFVTMQEERSDNEDCESPECAYAEQQALALVARTFQQLPASTQLICEGRLAGESSKSIAARLGIKLRTVYRHLRFAHERCAQALGMRMDGERDYE